MKARVLLLVTVLLVAGSTSHGADWRQWRGENASGVAEVEGLPFEFDGAKNLLWKTPLPGPAGASPVVASSKVFLTSPVGPELCLLAYDTASGEELWRRTVTVGEETFRGDEGNLASPSPVTDGRLIVSMMGDGVAACYTTDGEPVWRRDLTEDLGKLNIQFGYSSTPVLHDGRVYLQWIHGEGDPETREARVACLDLATGEPVWNITRVTPARDECEHSYASPILASSGDEVVLVTHGADFTIAYRPEDGAELWRVGGMNSPANYHSTLRFVASPAFGESFVVSPSAKKGPVTAIDLGGSGDLTNGSKIRWRLSRGTPDVPSPLIHEGLVYLCGENGNLACHDAGTGERLYLERTVSDRHRASPLLADGKIFLCSRSGVVTVVRPGPDFEILAKNDLGEAISASPAVADGTLFIRTFDSLYAFRQR